MCYTRPSTKHLLYPSADFRDIKSRLSSTVHQETAVSVGVVDGLNLLQLCCAETIALAHDGLGCCNTRTGHERCSGMLGPDSSRL